MTDGVTLRPVLAEDLDVLERLMNDPVAAGPFDWFGWSDFGWYRDYWARSGLLSDDNGTLAVLKDGGLIGYVSWRKGQHTVKSHYWVIAICIAPEARGHGYGALAQRLLVEYLFAHTTVNRIEAVTEVENIPERRALVRAGFTEEGISRGSGFRDGRWRDFVVYSILRSEVL